MTVIATGFLPIALLFLSPFLPLLTASQTTAAAHATAANYWTGSVDGITITSELGFNNNINVTENTLEAFEEGISRGATSIEFTARLTGDSKIALLHNDVYHDFVVESSTFNELRLAAPGVIELEDALDFMTSHNVAGGNIMLQNNPIEPGYDIHNTIASVVVSRLTAAGLSDRMLVTAFDLPTVSAAKAACVTVGSSCEATFGWLVMKGAPARYMAPGDYVKLLVKNDIDVLVPEAGVVVQDDYALLQSAELGEAGVLVYVWWTGAGTKSRENVKDMRMMKELGVAGFITPRVGMGVLVRDSK